MSANTFSCSTSCCAAVTLRAVSPPSSAFTRVSLRLPSSPSAFAFAKRALMPSRMPENVAEGPDVGTMLPILISVSVMPGSFLHGVGASMCFRFLNWSAGLASAPAAPETPSPTVTSAAALRPTTTRANRRCFIVPPGSIQWHLWVVFGRIPSTYRGRCVVALRECRPGCSHREAEAMAQSDPTPTARTPVVDFDLFAATSRDGSDAAWREASRSVPGGVDRAERRPLDRERVRGGGHRVP